MNNLVLLEIKNGYGIIKINRPKQFNALNREIVDEIDAVLDTIKQDNMIRALVIASEKNFAAGADITAMMNLTPQEAYAFLFSETFNKLENLSIPTIAAVNGYALGGGLELALACDIRIAGEEAKMGFPEINLGIMPGAGGTVRLPRAVGIGKAKEMIFMGNMIVAAEAERIGLVQKVVPSDNVLKTACSMAEKLSQKSMTALQTVKLMLKYSASQPSEAAMRLESSLWSGLFGTPDQIEGMKAFADKRKPKFK